MGRHRAGDTLEMRIAARTREPVRLSRARIASVGIGRWLDDTLDADWLAAIRGVAANLALLVVPVVIAGAGLAVTWNALLAGQTFS